MSNIAYKLVNDAYRSFTLCRDSKYSLCYRVGSTVSAVPDTLGIMCFSSLQQAREFCVSDILWIPCKILKVQGITMLPTPTSVCKVIRDYYLDLYYINRCPDLMTPPTGTVCFESVKVLKEINNDRL